MTMTTQTIDKAAVLDALARIAWAVDEGTPAELAGLLTSDARLTRIARDGTRQEWSTASGLSDFIAQRRSVAGEDRQTWTGDAMFSQARDGSVHVTSTSLRVVTLAGGTSNVLVGDEDVHDRLIPTDGGWLLASRTMTSLGAVAPPLAMAEPIADDGASTDRTEIEALFADYAWALDTADMDAILTLFSADAVMQDPYGRFTGNGPDGIGRFFEGLFARAEFSGRIHWVSQLVLTPIADGYRADSYAMVPASYSSGAVNLHLVAFYRDTIVRENGAWRFRERLVGPRWERSGAATDSSPAG